MTHDIKTFSISDPRNFDGNPYEVAARACAQAEALAKILKQSVNDAMVMTRNAEMERQMLDGGEPDAGAFERGPHAQAFRKAELEAANVETRLKMLGRAAGFDPKGRLDG